MAWLARKKRRNPATGQQEIYWWVCTRDENGKIRSRGLGFCEKKEAERALKVFEGKLAAGEPLVPTRTASGSSREVRATRTLADYLDAVYLPVVARDKAAGTLRSARCAAQSVRRGLGALGLAEVDFRRVDAHFTARRAAGRRARTLAIELWLLRGCLQHAVDCGELSSMPKLPAVRVRDRYVSPYLTTDQSLRVLDALRPLANQPHVVTRGAPPLIRDRLSYLAVLVALNLGMRKGEILTRGWEDVRWDLGPNGTILVRAKPEIGFDVKTRRERAVPMTPDVRSELAALHEELGRPDLGWIFPSTENPRKPRQDFKKALANACRRAGVPVVHPHALRHTWATRLATAGVDRRTLMELGGWTSSAVLDEIYSHAPDAHKADVMGRMGIGPRR